jgi:5-methylcytosine-specific restriction endonuclease McrA
MKRADPFYLSAPWRALRLQALQRDRFRCVVCGCSVAAPGSARVDHILPRLQHPELALSLSNLRTLCSAHDNQAHREKGRAAAAGRVERFVVSGCTSDGMPLDTNHPWNKL